VPILIALDLRANLLGFGLAMFDLTIVALGFLIGSLVDRGDKRVLIFYGLLLFALTGMALGTTLGPLFLLLGFLATVGDETTNLSLWSWLHTLDKDHARDGTMAGAICLAEDLGYTVAPVLAGIIYSAYGPAWSIAAGALPLLVVWGAYAFFIRPIHSSSAPYPVPVPTMPTRRRHKSYR
jgi:MFS family permease